MTWILGQYATSSHSCMTLSWRKQSIFWEVGTLFRRTLTSWRDGLTGSSCSSGKENVKSCIWGALRFSCISAAWGQMGYVEVYCAWGDKLNVRQQCALVAMKANSIYGYIRKNTAHRSWQVIIPFSPL